MFDYIKKLFLIKLENNTCKLNLLMIEFLNPLKHT
jgi:hypothetical protein